MPSARVFTTNQLFGRHYTTTAKLGPDLEFPLHPLDLGSLELEETLLRILRNTTGGAE